eukprot:1146211-Pelagomonas_calceolata.AAC.1
MQNDLPGKQMQNDSPGQQMQNDSPGTQMQNDLPGQQMQNDLPGKQLWGLGCERAETQHSTVHTSAECPEEEHQEPQIPCLRCV